jgi:uncharacterized protein YndB with AHSA1/START domain
MFSRSRPVSHIVELIIDIVAPRFDLFTALTDADLHRRWLGGGSVVELTLGEWSTVNETGRVLDCDDNRRLVFSRRPIPGTTEDFYFPDDTPASVAIFELEERSDTETVLTFLAVGIPNREAKQECERVWRDALERLRQYLELGREWDDPPSRHL